MEDWTDTMILVLNRGRKEKIIYTCYTDYTLLKNIYLLIVLLEG